MLFSVRYCPPVLEELKCFLQQLKLQHSLVLFSCATTILWGKLCSERVTGQKSLTDLRVDLNVDLQHNHYTARPFYFWMCMDIFILLNVIYVKKMTVFQSPELIL